MANTDTQQQVNVLFSNEQVNKIRWLSLWASQQKGDKVTMAEIIRSAIEDKYFEVKSFLVKHGK